jgi:hypothetical protein
MARRKLSKQELADRAKTRRRLRAGWYYLDSPAPRDGKHHASLMPFVAKKDPLIVSTLVPPEPKPKTERAPLKKRRRAQDHPDQPLIDFTSE